MGPAGRLAVTTVFAGDAVGGLGGSLVELRPFTSACVTDAYLGWLHDGEVLRFSNQRFRAHTRELCLAYLASFSGTPNDFLAIYLRDSGRMVGTMTAYVASHHATADLGILIGDRACWGRGIGRDAWQTVMDHLLGPVGLRKVTGGTLRGNAGMVRIMERSGMHLEATRVQQEIVDGVAQDALYYAKFRNA